MPTEPTNDRWKVVLDGKPVGSIWAQRRDWGIKYRYWWDEKENTVISGWVYSYDQAVKRVKERFGEKVEILVDEE